MSLDNSDLEALRGFLLEEVILRGVESTPGFWMWVMDRSWLDECLSMRDGCGHPFWEPQPNPGDPLLMFGIPVKLASGDVFPRLERTGEKASA